MLSQRDAVKVANWTMPFGKYKGQKFREIDDPRYLEWIIEKTDFFKDDKYPRNKKIREYLEHIVECIPFSTEMPKGHDEKKSEIVKHVEENNIPTDEWIHGTIIKLDELICNYEVMEDEEITSETVIHVLKRSQRYMWEFLDIINSRTN